jgi:hypothetical protein
MNSAGYRVLQSILPQRFCGTLRDYALERIQDQRFSIGYNFTRLWSGAVNQPYRRHIVPLPLEGDVLDAVRLSAFEYKTWCTALIAQPLT